jgi:thioredoxin 1
LEIKDIRSEKELRTTMEHGIALILFSEPWFAPCRLQEPILRRLASRFQGSATMGAVRVDESPEIAWNLGIQGLPTVILFKKGKEIQRFVGLQPENTLLNAVRKLLK